MADRMVDLFPVRVAVCDDVLPQEALDRMTRSAYSIWDRLNTGRRAFGRDDRTPVEVLDPETFLPAAERVKEKVTELFGYEVDSIEGREVVFHDGDYITPHIEPGCDLSAELFLDYSAKPNPQLQRYDGCLTIENPSGCWGNLTLPWEEYRVWTKDGVPGRLVIHPAYTPHYVHPYYGSRPGVNIHYEIKLRRC